MVEVKIIRSDGGIEEHSLPEETWFNEVEQLIDSRCFDLVRLKDGTIMLVDDDGYMKARPTNLEATMLATLLSEAAIGSAGILGDVAIVRKEALK